MVAEDTLLRLFLEAVYADERRRTTVGLRKVFALGKELGMAEGKAEAKREYEALLRARGMAA